MFISISNLQVASPTRAMRRTWRFSRIVSGCYKAYLLTHLYFIVLYYLFAFSLCYFMYLMYDLNKYRGFNVSTTNTLASAQLETQMSCSAAVCCMRCR